MLLRRFCTSLLLVFSCFSFVTPALAAKAPAAKTPVAAAPSPDDLIWRGDHATGRAIMEDLAKQYAKEKKGKILLEPFSTLSGLDAVAQGTADFAGSARAKYARRAEESSLNFVPVALDGAVLITHPKNPVNGLTLKQIYDIYYGRIKNWKELGGEDKDINLYAIASPLDGVEYSLRELVFRNGDQRVAAPRLYINTAKLEEAITLDPAGLGLSTMANTFSNKGVKMLSVEGVSATTATIADGSYPLYITLYLAERANAPKQTAIDHFLAFLETPAAKDILRKHQLTPYSDAGAVAARNDQRMSFIDAHVGRDAASITAAMTTAAAVIAPPASQPAAPAADAPTHVVSIIPTQESAAKKTTTAAASTPKKPAPKKEVAATKKKTESAEKTTKVASAAAPKKAAKAKATATADAPVAAPKPAASFGNVNGGAAGG